MRLSLLVVAALAVACSEDPPVRLESVVATAPKETPDPEPEPPPPLPCPHPYLPLAEGARWDSTLAEGRTRTKVRTEVRRLTKSVDSWRAPVEIRLGERVVHGSATCDRDGAYMEIGGLRFVGEVGGRGGAADLRDVGRNGYLLPHGDRFAVGAAWPLELATLVSVGDALTKRATVRASFQAVRREDEEVRTAAGTFTAAHVELRATANEEAVIMGRTVAPRTLPAFSIDVWLAEGVGEVRTVLTQGETRREWTLASRANQP